jgi:general secretion pathway protein A
MLYGIHERKGFIVITGGIGTGKTTLCRTLLNSLGEDTGTALIFNSFISDMELLKSVNQEFGIQMPPGSETKKDYIDALNLFLLDIFAKGRNAVLVIDEAQNLSREVLEQIRMLSNLETAKEKLIQIVLIGQPELKSVLSAPSLRQLNERVMVRYDLNPLSFRDIRGYMEHRMIVAGGHGLARFTKGALREIYAYSRGNPRRINNVCDRALLVSYAMGKYDVTGGIIKKSIKELSGDNYEGLWGMRWNPRLLYSLFVLVLIIAAGFVGWSYRGRLSSGVPAEDVTQVSQKKNDLIAEAGKKSEPPSLYTDGRESLSTLFSMFYSRSEAGGNAPGESYPDVVTYNISSEYYVSLKKPFRVSVPAPVNGEKYLVMKDATDKGATAIDADGKERAVDRDFIIKNWGGEVTWVYPTPKKSETIIRGSSNAEVLELQKALNSIGYMIEATGTYDQVTSQEIMKFQKDFDLHVDGIAGPRTRALLYQMVM